MDRRRFLAGLLTGAGTLAGCLSAPTATSSGSRTTGVTRLDEVDLPVPERDLVRAAPRDGIPAITDTAFGTDWDGLSMTVTRSDMAGVTREVEIEPRLRPADDVIGIERDGTARAYPLRVLNWHEVVNDSFGGPLLVTYCPLCGSAVTAGRTVGGAVTTFGVSGLLWRSDLVMYDDRSGSLWSQLVATAIRGPRTGDTLSQVPSTLTTWDSWRDSHPETDVLLPPPQSATVDDDQPFDYSADRYGRYRGSREEGLSGAAGSSPLHPKMRVLGVRINGEVRAYPYAAVRERGVVNDRVGGVPLMVVTPPDESVSSLAGTMVGFDRRAMGRTLEFTVGTDGLLQAGNSRWRPETGIAIDGPYVGSQLARIDARATYWFAWRDFHPETTLFGR